MDCFGEREHDRAGQPGDGGGGVPCSSRNGVVERTYGRDLLQGPSVSRDRFAVAGIGLGADSYPRNFTDVFKTPGKMRGKTPRTTRKRTVEENRVVGLMLLLMFRRMPS